MQMILIYDDNVCNHSLEKKKEVSKDLINGGIVVNTCILS